MISYAELTLVVGAGLLGIVSTWVLTPLAMAIATKYGVIDLPGGRRVHTHPTPRWGGLAMCAAFMLAVLGIAPLRQVLLHEQMLTPRVLGILLGGVLITGLGAWDDKFNVAPKMKLLGQVFVATVLVVPLFGVSVLPLDPARLVAFDVDLGAVCGASFTVLWIVAITNTINLIDGLDGLAAGVAGIAALTFTVLGLAMYGAFSEAILAAALVGVCLGFLRYNFHPARVFMGDAGSHFLGFTLAALSVLQNWKVATGMAFSVPVLVLSAPIIALPFAFIGGMLVPMLIFSVPICDTTFAILRRLHRRQPIFSPDKGHLHHRLLSFGWPHRTVVLTIYLLTAAGCAVALVVARGRMPHRTAGTTPPAVEWRVSGQ